MAAERLKLANLVLRRDVPGPDQPSPGEPAERPARPMQMLDKALSQDTYRRSLEVQRDIAALQGSGQGKGKRGKQLLEPGIGNDRGVTLPGRAQRMFGDDIPLAAIDVPGDRKLLAPGTAPGPDVVVYRLTGVGDQL